MPHLAYLCSAGQQCVKGQSRLERAQAAGRGHMDYAPIVKALREIQYDGYASVEAFPIPDSLTTARHTMVTFQKCFR